MILVLGWLLSMLRFLVGNAGCHGLLLIVLGVWAARHSSRVNLVMTLLSCMQLLLLLMWSLLTRYRIVGQNLVLCRAAQLRVILLVLQMSTAGAVQMLLLVLKVGSRSLLPLLHQLMVFLIDVNFVCAASWTY